MNSLNMQEQARFGISSFTLHILAMVFMLFDHLWGTSLIRYDWLTYVGRIAFPIFAFLLVEGFHYTGNLKKYVGRLFVFALLSEIPFNLMMGGALINPLHQNVLWTFLLAIGAMALFRKLKKLHVVPRILLYIVLTMVFYLLGFITFVDYYGYGILFVLLFYFTRIQEGDSALKRGVFMGMQLLLMYYINSELISGLMIPINIFGLSFEMHTQNFSLLALPLLWLYNGRQGPHNKWIQYANYAFYPVHMLLLAILMIV